MERPGLLGFGDGAGEPAMALWEGGGRRGEGTRMRGGHKEEEVWP